MISLLAIHALAAVIAPVLVSKIGKRAFWVLALAPASVFCWAAVQLPRVIAGDLPQITIAWVASLGLHLDFRVDVLSLVMSLIVGGIGALILVYCSDYFGSGASSLGRFGGVFVAFAGAMFGLVTADNTLLFYIFWELTTVFSFLLIGHYHDRQPSRRAALLAITLTTMGGLAMLAGFVMLGLAPQGSFRLSELVAHAADGSLTAANPTGYLSAAAILVLAGALTKSAQVPFHFWLPAAMAAPTPVSGYLHAAAMVKAGVYLVARFAPGFSTVPGWRLVVIGFGLATMLLGGYRALRQFDLKLILAFGTVSQLGFILVLVGYGDRAVALAGLAMLIAHSLFKATLFLTVGVIDHQLGTRDLRELSGVARAMPLVTSVACLAAASMAGLPPLLGYVGKEAALESLVHLHDWPVFVTVVLGSVLTFAYTLRFCWGAFANKARVDRCEKEPLEQALVWPVVILGSAGFVLGIGNGWVERLLAGYAATFPGEAGHLTLWGGFGLPVVGTLVIIVVGAAMFVARDYVAWAQRQVRMFSAEDSYRGFTWILNRGAGELTAAVQRGSLPNYLMVMLVTMVGASAATILVSDLTPLSQIRWWDSPLQGMLALAGCIGAILVVRARRRMKAVLLLAFVGYATSVLFALYGAPDLALTQAVVETVSLVIFILVMRRLPPYFSNRPWAGSRITRAIIGALSGIAVALMGWYATSARIHEPVTVDYPNEVLSFGYGRNIVNVTLVDTRAWDTIGEVSVLLAAATGVASLIYLRDRTKRDFASSFKWAISHKSVWAMRDVSRRLAAERYVASGRLNSTANQMAVGALPGGRRGRVWLAGSTTLSDARRSLVLEVGARVLFHPIMLFSLFLLFSGHNNPGGGFAGGVVAGIALAIRYLAGGRYELALATKIRPGVMLGVGMMTATLAALLPVAFGGTIVQTTVFDLTLPLFNHVHLATAMFFDIGVYLIVVGLVLDILTSLGAEIDRMVDAEEAAHPELGTDDVDMVSGELDASDDLRGEDE